MKILGIAGRKGAGKDTLAQTLIVANGGKFELVKFADPLKNMMRAMLKAGGVSPTEIEHMIEGSLKEVPHKVLLGKTPRYAMQTLGTEWRNMLGENLWINMIEQRLRSIAAGGAHGVVITDLRFAHECEFLRGLGATTVRISGGRSVINAASDHPSETAIDTLPVDMEVINLGTIADLASTATVVASKVNKSAL